VIGDPIEHSLSPAIQNLAFHHLRLNSIYVAFRVKQHHLKNAVKGIKSLGISGFNVTIPHKVTIMKYLDEIVDNAIGIGAVNTVINREGTLVGYNTDGTGALSALRETCVRFRGSKVVLLGAGGAAKALAATLAPLVEQLIILNRTEIKAKDLANILTNARSRVKGAILSETVLHYELPNTDVLINATSLGMYPRIDVTPVKQKYLHSDMTVFDIVYNPLKTRLLREAEAVGAHIVGGVKMLVYQGAQAFELWTGKEPPIDEMYRTMLRILETKQNAGFCRS
jgi:shikimate dehydrogenase